MIIFECLICLITVGVLYYLFPIIQVCGSSMCDTYQDGEFIVATRLFRRSKVKEGDVVIYHALKDDRIVIKRVARTIYFDSKKYMYCLGDNPDESYDSRHYGYVPVKNIVCKAIVKREEKGIESHENAS